MSIQNLKINETDDEFFETLESRSNLANLFGVNQQKDDVNQSLKYKPPKQVQGPGDVGGNESSAISWSVQVAKVVTAFKLINQENLSQGRVGLALLKNSQNDFKIIVYRTKSNVLATLTLLTGSKLILKSSFLQFHDDSQEFWSIFLENPDQKSFIDHLPPEFLSTIEEPKPVIPEEPEPQPSTDDSDTASKAKLLSRMARMGQPLPKLATPTTATDMSDSSDTEVINIPPKPSIPPRKVSKQLVPVGNALQSTSGIVAYAPQIQDNLYMNMLLTENRTQNTELRMNLSKLETKIERVLDKMDSIGTKETSQANVRDKDDEIVGLEEKILELRKENRTLRQTARELEAKKSAPVINEPKLKLEMFSGFKDVMELLGVHLEDSKDLEDVTMDLLEKSRSKLNGLRTECKTKDKELADIKTEVSRLKLENTDLKKAVKDTEDLRNNVETLSTENRHLKEQLERDKPNSNEQLQDVVKQIMNNLYSNIATSLDATTEPLTNETILRICGNAIRKETINAIQGKAK